MTDETDRQEAEAEEPEARGPRAGERLAAARRDKQITVLEIAKELHLDEPKVRALERNEFDVLGAPVFAKGHLRKYAQLVDVDPADVLTEYYEMNRSGPAPLVVTGRARPRKELSPGPWIAIIVVLILLAAAYWWFAMRTPAIPLTPRPEPQPQLSESEPVPAVEEPGPAPPPADGEVRLTVTYSGDCWTEITDAGGSRLFFDLGSAGRSVTVTGEAPLNVLFGNAENVSVAVNGVDRPIVAADRRRGRTARLTIEQP
jgi:cytoskeletal protein RodZ